MGDRGRLGSFERNARQGAWVAVLAAEVGRTLGAKMDKDIAATAHPGNVVEISHTLEVVYCEACGSDRVYRIERKGFLRRKVFPMFGLYPWQCRDCGHRLMMRMRSRRRVKKAYLKEG